MTKCKPAGIVKGLLVFKLSNIQINIKQNVICVRFQNKLLSQI